MNIKKAYGKFPEKELLREFFSYLNKEMKKLLMTFLKKYLNYPKMEKKAEKYLINSKHKFEGYATFLNSIEEKKDE